MEDNFRKSYRESNVCMNKKNWLVIGAVVLIAFGVWFYIDSREDVGLGPQSATCGHPNCQCSGNSCRSSETNVYCYVWNGDVCEITACSIV